MDVLKPKIRVMCCSIHGCGNHATWKMGTWYACDHHIIDYVFKKTPVPGLDSIFGTVYKFEKGYCEARPEDPESTTVEMLI